jgi:hypothetical protein
MRIWAAHAVFATILAGSLAAQARRVEPLDDNESALEAAILRVAGSHDWRLRDYVTTGGMLSQTLVFEAPGCSQPVFVGLRLSTFEEEALTGNGPEPGYALRYAYFDETWDRPQPRAAGVTRLKYGVLATLGLTEYAPSRHLLMIDAPADCRTANLDWRPIWTQAELERGRVNADAPR